MKALFVPLLFLTPSFALAQGAAPTPEPTASPAATPVATPGVAPTPDATPAPTDPGLPPTAPPAPHRRWELEAAIHSVGIFESGMHVFSEEPWLSGPELRLRRAIAPADARIAVAPEISYGFGHAGRSYVGGASTELWLQRFSAGARTTVHDSRLRALTPFVRTGATGLWGTALAHDLYRDYREEAYGFGLYASAGAELDFTHLASRRTRFVAGAEVGHLYTGGLTFGEMGTLDVNGLFFSVQASLRF